MKKVGQWQGGGPDSIPTMHTVNDALLCPPEPPDIRSEYLQSYTFHGQVWVFASAFGFIIIFLLVCLLTQKDQIGLLFSLISSLTAGVHRGVQAPATSWPQLQSVASTMEAENIECFPYCPFKLLLGYQLRVHPISS